MRDDEIKLFPIEKALSKQIPLKVNGFAETRNFPHLVKQGPQGNQKKLLKRGNSNTCKALSKQIPLKVNWIC